MVDSGTGVGKYPSLDLRYDDQAYISYYHGGLGELRYAYHAGIGNCGSGDAWYCTTIDTDGHVGAHSSILAPRYSGDLIRVAYYDLDYHQLKYAHSGMSSGSGNCGPANSWQCSVVDDMNAYLPVGISMKMDLNGSPIIAYQYTDPDNPEAYDLLRIARPNFVYGDSGSGNCGDVPAGDTEPFWRCTTLDSAGYYTDEADYVSLAVNENGLRRDLLLRKETVLFDRFLEIGLSKGQRFLASHPGAAGRLLGCPGEGIGKQVNTTTYSLTGCRRRNRSYHGGLPAGYDPVISCNGRRMRRGYGMRALSKPSATESTSKRMRAMFCIAGGCFVDRPFWTGVRTAPACVSCPLGI